MKPTKKRKLSYEQKVLYIFFLSVVFTGFILPFLIPARKHPITEYMCQATCKSNLKNIAFHCKMYKGDNGTFPGSFLDLDRNKYLVAGRAYVCYHYSAYNVNKVVNMENKNPKKLLYTSYDYLGPDGEYEPSLGEMILIREKVRHPCAQYKSVAAGYHVVTKNLEVKFISTKKENFKIPKVTKRNVAKWQLTRDKSLSFRISSDKNIYKASEPVTVVAELKNNSDSNIAVLPIESAFGNAGDAIHIVGPGKVGYSGPFKSMPLPKKVIISSGKMAMAKASIDNRYEGFGIPGKYKISCSYAGLTSAIFIKIVNRK